MSSFNYELFTWEFFLLIKPFTCPSCPFLVQHLTSCIPAIGGILFLFVLLTLLRTSFSDPGILPRATPDEAAQVERQIGKFREVSGSFRKGVCEARWSCPPQMALAVWTTGPHREPWRCSSTSRR